MVPWATLKTGKARQTPLRGSQERQQGTLVDTQGIVGSPELLWKLADPTVTLTPKATSSNRQTNGRPERPEKQPG